MIIPPTNDHSGSGWNDTDDDEGWGDEDLVIDNDLAMRKIAGSPVSAPPLSLPGGTAPRAKLKIPGVKTTGVPTAKPAVKKLTIDDTIDDGWDDF